MKTSTKVWLGIGGYFAGQAIGAGLINAAGQAGINKFNAKFEQVQDLYYSKKNDLTEDKRDEIRERLDTIHENVGVDLRELEDNKTILLSVGIARVATLKKRLKASIKALERIEDDLNGIVIDAK